MDLYKENVFGEAMREENKTARNGNVMTNILPFDTDLRAGKDYYIVVQTMYEEEDYELTEKDFTIDGQCAKFTILTLQGSGVIKIDGVAVNDGEPVDVCLGQSPVVQVDLKMYKGSTTTDVTKEFEDAGDHYYDWYLGSVEDFISTEAHEPSYYSLLQSFREDDKNSTELPEDKEYDVLRQLVSNGELVLHASSFVFPPVKDTENHLIVLTAMPIIPDRHDDNTYVICSQPSEIRLRVQNSAPLMHDGFEGIPYDEAGIVDVPFRVGLSQLRSVSYQDIAQTDGISKCLELPLRNLTSYKGTSNSVKMYGDITTEVEEVSEWDPFAYLVETNDPLYIGLNKHPEDETQVEGLLPIGMIVELNAEKNEAVDKHDNLVKLVFSNKMKFREGYYYRVRFSYNEEVKNNAEGYCLGQVVFTLKVVPEYMKWTGAESRNWNNDANWSRVTAKELLLADGDGKIDDHTIANANDNSLSYAPLDFTKVVVPNLRKEYVDATAENPVLKSTEGYPWMFTSETQDVRILGGTTLEWSTTEATDDTKESTINIKYDMTSLDSEAKLACRPWYANTCEEIHFNQDAQLLHQENFLFGENYQKAWVDMEMNADRWYTLASPLQGVVAGDMYTKTNGGKEDNELFTDINFDNNKYGRYAPAVYQRGWNKAEAKTYILGDGTHDSKSAAVELNWSRVYNDVDENYAPGTGFSVRTEAKNISNWNGNGDVVRFRLPKADTTYSYFDPNDDTEEADDTEVTRQGERHSLVPFTDGEFKAKVPIGNDGQYFLVGNPFIACMNMAEFFDKNKDVIDSYYWIMTDDRQEAFLWDEKSGSFIGTDKSEDVKGIIPPMQGFFVKAKQKARELPLTFTPDMIVTEANVNDNVPSLRSEYRYQPQVISVSALDADGEITSRAIINIDPLAQAAYDDSEDATLLLDRSLDNRASVYTVASEKALAINSLDAIAETEVGLLATEGSTTTLMFDGIDDSENLLLLDTANGSLSNLYSGMRVNVEGSVSGRFYITRLTDGLTESTLAVVIKNHTVSIVSGIEGITARVYTPSGLCMGEWSVDDTCLEFDLESGIFIVEAVSDNQRVTRKFVVK